MSCNWIPILFTSTASRSVCLKGQNTLSQAKELININMLADWSMKVKRLKQIWNQEGKEDRSHSQQINWFNCQPPLPAFRTRERRFFIQSQYCHGGLPWTQKSNKRKTYDALARKSLACYFTLSTGKTSLSLLLSHIGLVWCS